MSEVATGTCAEISERGDWTTFHIDTGGKYPVKLASKKSEIIELGRAASRNGGEFDWTYNEVESEKINEHTGKPFINRYLEGVQPAGSAPVSDSPATRATPDTARRAQAQNRSYAPDLKDRMIVRQTALKAAAEIMAANSSVHPDYDPALEVMRAAARFETWVYRDIDPPPSEAGRPALSEHDDNIPF
jgi:hypothetical protein